MSLSIFSIYDFLSNNSAITALVPATNIWINIAGDGSALPFIILNQVSMVSTYLVAGKRISKLHLQITVYASTLSSCDAITTAIQGALINNAVVTSNTWGTLLKSGPNPSAETQGAYQVILEYDIWEDLN